MENYSERLTITVPVSLAEVAAKIGKALDPDVGGEDSFNRDIAGYDGETPIYGNTISTSTPCTVEFKVQAEYLMTDANALHQALSVQFETRWPDLTAPTLAQCQLFIDNIITG